MSSTPLMWSVIIPTLNRGDSLKRTLEGLARQNLHPLLYEILVVDNGSTDHTEAVVQNCMQAFPTRQIRFLKVTPPGLLSGRHGGALESQGKILTFVDDDIDVGEGYGAAILAAFQAPEVHIVGGPCRPLFESEPPAWMARYSQQQHGRLTCASLSLHDLGDKAQLMDPTLVWGLNFSIRRETLWECGGFHPDNVPQQYQMYQGDGETGLCLRVRQRGYKAHYVPGAAVTHVIPASRLTEAYFSNRFFYQGVCDSYTEIRTKGNTQNLHIPMPRPVDEGSSEALHQRIHNAYVDGYLFHQSAVKHSPCLLGWVTRQDYWDYNYPTLEEGVPYTRQWAEALLSNALDALGDVAQTLTLATRYAEKGHVQRALKTVASVERRFTDSAEVKMVRCLILEHAGKINEATLTAEEALRLDDGCEQALAFMRRSRNGDHSASLTQVYDIDFYTEDGELSRLSAQKVLPFVMKLLAPQSVQDFGCGQGDWLATFRELGVSTTIGYDANALNPEHLLVPATTVRQCCDFTSPTFAPEVITDMAISLEVAEHLPEDAASGFVRVLTAAAPCVLFSAALPCQTGVSHINERSFSFWQNIFQQYGYVLFDVIRPHIIYDNNIAWWYRQNIVLFISQEYLKEHSDIYKKLSCMAKFYPMHAVHKDNVERLCKSHHAIQHIDAAFSQFLTSGNIALLEKSITSALCASGDPDSMTSLRITKAQNI